MAKKTPIRTTQDDIKRSSLKAWCVTELGLHSQGTPEAKGFRTAIKVCMRFFNID